MNKIFFAILLLATLLSAQFKEKEDFDPRQKLLSSGTAGGILDAERFSLDQTYSMSYSSGTNHSMATGQYIAGLNYRFSDPLSLKVELAASFVPYTTFSLPSDQKSQFYFKSATLDYRPNDSFRMKIQLDHNPGGAAGWSNYQNRFDRFGFMSLDEELDNP